MIPLLLIRWSGEWQPDDDNESAHANYGSNGMDDEIYLAPTNYSDKDDYQPITSLKILQKLDFFK